MDRELWDEWRAMPVTQEVLRAVDRMAAEVAATALEQSLDMGSVESTALHVARMQGVLDGLRALANSEFEDLLEGGR